MFKVPKKKAPKGYFEENGNLEKSQENLQRKNWEHMDVVNILS